MIGRGHRGEPWAQALSGAFVALALAAAPATAADSVRIAAQKTGTLAWELAVVRAHGLDRQAGLEIVTADLATPEAGKIALRGGSADVIVSDWLWVSRERALGSKLVFYPYSSALGAVMAAPTAPIQALADLKGRSLAIAGGPLDKSWLLLQAALKQDGIELKTQASVAYGAPVLLAAKTLRGEFDATLNYWNIAADLEAKGILASSDDEWQRIGPLAGVTDAAALRILRDRYRAGIPRRPIADEEADARVLYGVLARVGGAELVGPARELAPGTFYRPEE